MLLLASLTMRFKALPENLLKTPRAREPSAAKTPPANAEIAAAKRNPEATFCPGL